ncbi:hypothetical protein VNO77_08233 [Canavalia gladiata]|uniref:Uncharacterized protein n=1 Tax=Canavalia gladiata TaxID=3824 RepID=A0AAN9MC32_CANGL
MQDSKAGWWTWQMHAIAISPSVLHAPNLECPSHEYPIQATSTTSVLKGKGRFEDNLPQSHGVVVFDLITPILRSGKSLWDVVFEFLFQEDQTPCICGVSGFRSQQRSWGQGYNMWLFSSLTIQGTIGLTSLEFKKPMVPFALLLQKDPSPSLNPSDFFYSIRTSSEQ